MVARDQCIFAMGPSLHMDDLDLYSNGGCKNCAFRGIILADQNRPHYTVCLYLQT